MSKAVGSTGRLKAATFAVIGIAAALTVSALLLAGCVEGDDEEELYTAIYKVTFNANGGSGTVPGVQSVPAGSAITLPNQGSLTRSGYDFGGWNTKTDGKGTNYSVASSYTPTGSITLYARWIQAGTPPPSIIPDEIRTQFETKMPIYSGTTPPDISGQYVANNFTLAGSSFSVDNIGEKYDDDQYIAFIRRADGKLSYRERIGTFEFGGDDMMVGIVGTGNSFTVYYIINRTSGGITTKESTIMSGTLTSNGIQNFNYAFIILEKGPDPQNQYMPVNSFRIFKDGDGLAEKYSWINSSNPTTYTVTFDANGGSGTAPAALTVNSGSDITLPNQGSLTKSGYDFDGWNANASGTGTNYSAGSPYTPAGNVTLYAKWTPQSVTPPSSNTFIDVRDNKTYKKVKIGNQTWMAENLNYDIPGVASDICYNNDPAYCDTYGRLYSWTTAMGNVSASSENPSGVQGVCPTGWHLPSDAEWGALANYVGTFVGQRLRSSTGWNTSTVVGTDEFGFAALPGGWLWGSSSGDVGDRGCWWTTTANGATYAYRYYMDYGSNELRRDWFDLDISFSVRCVQN